MTLKCTGCGKVSENEKDIRFCTEKTNRNGDPCGSLMLPVEENAKPVKHGKEGE